MSHGVHAVQHEVEHQIEHEHHGPGKVVRDNRKIALLIAIIALFLAISEMLGKGAQTEALTLNIKSSDTWNFFQAKTVRQTTLRTAAEALAIEIAARPDEAFKTAMAKQVEAWRATVARYESDPKEKDGRKELRAQAEQYERERDRHLARYHNYEFASAAYQIAIVLSSAAVITGMIGLVYGAIGLAGAGLVFTALGLFAPELPHEVVHWFAQLSSSHEGH